MQRLEAMEVPTAARSRRPSRWDRPRPPRDWRFFVGGLGRVLISLGLLLFGFVAYQLWGTGIQQAQAQQDLGAEFEELGATLDTAPTTTAPPTTDTTQPGTGEPPTTTTPPLLEVNDGDAIGIIEIPTIGVSQYLVAGVTTEDLRKGPGHYPQTPFPGELGNAAIAGHRTTYGEPFIDLDRLVPGDEIIVTMLGDTRYVYRVTGSQIVSPSDYEVILTTDPDVAVLTLTTCHPKYSAAQRLIVAAVLDEEASDPVGPAVIEYTDAADASSEGSQTVQPPTTEPATTEPTTSKPTTSAAPSTTATGPSADTAAPAEIDETIDAFTGGWFSDPDAWPQVALWGLALTAIAVLAYLLSRAVRRNWVGALVGIVPFVVTLYFFFQNVNRLLPPNL